ncbi:MAG TPA: hypothetical protein VI389_04940, partial [Geobacteraceae bacterium]
MPTDSGDKEKKQSTSLLIVANHFFDSLLVKYSTDKNEKRWRFILLVVTAFLLALLITPRQHFFSAGFKSGSIATA